MMTNFDPTANAPEGDYKTDFDPTPTEHTAPKWDEIPMSPNGLPKVASVTDTVQALKFAMFNTHRAIMCAYDPASVGAFDCADDEGKFAMMDDFAPFGVCMFFFCQAHEIGYCGARATLEAVRELVEMVLSANALDLPILANYVLVTWQKTPRQANKAIADKSIFRIMREMSR